MTKTSQKRVGYKCGKCGGSGHNARTCPKQSKTKKSTSSDTSKSAPEPKSTVPPVQEVVEPVVESVKAPAPIKIDETIDLLQRKRGGTTPNTPGCHECPRCKYVGVLVLVKLLDKDDDKSELRCERCHNSTPVKLILKWGCTMDDLPRGQNINHYRQGVGL